MFKKFTSMMTAAILLAAGLSVVGALSATAVGNTNANLRSIELYTGGGAPTAISGFDVNTTSYTVSTFTGQLMVLANVSDASATKVTTCNGTVIASDNNTNCVFASGANTYTVEVTATDGTTKKTYTITFNYTPPVSRTIASTSTINVGASNPQLVISSDINMSGNSAKYNINFGTTGLTLQGIAGGSLNPLTFLLLGTAQAGTITLQAAANAFSPSASGATNTLSFVVGGGSTPSQTAEQIAAAAAAAAKAAAEAAAAVRAAEIATAQTKLATALKGDKPGSIDDFKAANINVTTAASLARINAEVLKLSAADRADFAKIKAIADKIEFDESFFNATARPTVATYNAYGVTVTDRTVATINAKVLELPAAARLDVKAIQEIAKVESFVDRVANTETRGTVSATTLVEKGLLPATSPYKYSVVQGLAKYPEGSLNTMAKIEAAIKEQVAKAEAPKLRLAAIKAKIAARKK